MVSHCHSPNPFFYHAFFSNIGGKTLGAKGVGLRKGSVLALLVHPVFRPEQRQHKLGEVEKNFPFKMDFMAENANMIYLYIYMIYLLIYPPNNPPNVGKYGYLYTNLIDPI